MCGFVSVGSGWTGGVGNGGHGNWGAEKGTKSRDIWDRGQQGLFGLEEGGCLV